MDAHLSPEAERDPARIVDAAIRLFGERALNEVSLDAVAERAGLDVADVRRSFPDMAAVLVAAIAEWNRRRLVAAGDVAEHGAIAMLRVLLRNTESDPACARMVFAAADIAGCPGHPAAGDLQQLWVRFHAMVQRALVNDKAIGREPETLDPAAGTEQLLAIFEGLQFQWLVRQHLDMLGAFDRAVTRLRRGWAEAYVAPVWEI